MKEKNWITYNKGGKHRVVVTKELPGPRWLEILTLADCQVDVCASNELLTRDEIISAFHNQCDGAIGQLTEDWESTVFKAFRGSGGAVYSNYAVGFNNVDAAAASKLGIPIGNTPGVLTETTAEMAAALTFAAARRVVESDHFMRAGKYTGWLPTLFLGELLWRKTLGVIGMGRIGSAFSHMMVEGHKMNLIYYDLVENRQLEDDVAAYNVFLSAQGEELVKCWRAEGIEEVFRKADVVSVHAPLNETTHHLINTKGLSLMKNNAILVNASRGPLIDETALVNHCRNHPQFRAALDVYEDEPDMKPGLAALKNVVIVPHIGSATSWTRQGMATLAAANIAGVLMGYPAWQNPDITPFLGDDPPQAAPSIVNAREIGFPLYEHKY